MKKAKNEGAANALATELGCEKETAELVYKRIQARRLVKMLTAERVRHNLSQKEIAAKMNCSESKISRMESSNDVDLNFGDILAYARAAGINMSVLFDDSTLPNAPAAGPPVPLSLNASSLPFQCAARRRTAPAGQGVVVPGWHPFPGSSSLPGPGSGCTSAPADSLILTVRAVTLSNRRVYEETDHPEAAMLQGHVDPMSYHG